MTENTLVNYKNELIGEIDTTNELMGEVSIGSSGGTLNYDYLLNKPRINNVELTDNKTFENLGINEVSNTELDALFKDL